MSFDQNNPADLAALKSEQSVDPIGMGYAAVDGQTNKTLALFNDPDLNVGGETTGEAFTPSLILDVIFPDDLTVGNKFSSGQDSWLKLLLEASETLFDDMSQWEAKFRSLFDINPTPQTLLNLDSRLRVLSRAEVLFGEDTSITKSDWYAARDS